MTTNNCLLPKEAVALVQHIELNRAGWWDKTIYRLLLASVWLSDHPPSSNDIQAALKATFKLSMTTQKLMSTLDSLESRNMLLCLPNHTYRIPEEHRVVFEKEIAEAEKVEVESKALFSKLSAELGIEVEPEKLWSDFEHEFLGPLIKQVGANTYHLIAGEKMTADRSLVDRFLKPYHQELHTNLRALVATFIDPKKHAVCAHISRLLHARFCVEASGLSEDVLAKLNESAGKQVRFRMFIDTNFLFSLLELHENPSNAAAQELRDLIAQLKGSPRIDLVITPETIAEAKGSIAYTKGQLSGFPIGNNFTQAALQNKFSGMAMRFFSERLRRNGNLTPEEWFDPYLNNFVTIARSKGVELFNQKLDEYSTRQDVVDDILAVFKHEKRRPEGRRKSYQKVAHDMVLWHCVNDKRLAYVESPVDADFWILTVDYRLIGFDEHKQKHSKNKVPLCIHPASFIQLLQFWVPRTKEFEEAMLGNLRLPFLFQDFDAEGEKTSLKILKGIGRFEGGEGLSQDTITQVMLNDELRSRLQEGHTNESEIEIEIELIRDALLEEVKLHAEAQANNAKELQQKVLKSEAELAVIAAQKQAAENESAEIKKQKEGAEAEARQAFSSQQAELNAVNARLQAMEVADLRRTEKDAKDQARHDERKAFYTYIGWLTLVLLIASISAWQVERLFPWSVKILGSVPVKGLALVIIFIFGHLILEFSIYRKPAIALLWPCRKVKRFSKFLWAVVIIGLCGGVGGNIYANWIQKNIEAEQAVLPENEPKKDKQEKTK